MRGPGPAGRRAPGASTVPKMMATLAVAALPWLLAGCNSSKMATGPAQQGDSAACGGAGIAIRGLPSEPAGTSAAVRQAVLGLEQAASQASTSGVRVATQATADAFQAYADALDSGNGERVTIAKSTASRAKTELARACNIEPGSAG